MRTSIPAVLIALLATLACSDVKDTGTSIFEPPAPPAPPPGHPAAPPSLSAFIHGSAWTAMTFTATRVGSDVIEIAGSGVNAGGPMSIVLRITRVSDVGTHSLSALGDGSSLLINGTSLGPDFRWSTTYYWGTGVAHVSTLTPTRIAGFFDGTAVSASGSAEDMYVTNGRFDINF